MNKYDTCLIVGTRPNFVKAAPLLKQLEESGKRVLFIHTGQHFDEQMSNFIFKDLQMRSPDINLNTKPNTEPNQVGFIMSALDDIFQNNIISKVGVFGDVTSTLAASLSSKLNNIELFHVESGLRSRNLDMPEERNRIIVDSISDILLTPSKDAILNLEKEFIEMEKVHNVGNIMIDTLSQNEEKIDKNIEKLRNLLNLHSEYFVMTIHRPSNLTEDALERIFNAVNTFSEDFNIVLPAHPRLSQFIDKKNIKASNIKLINPLSYIDFLSLVKGSELVLTDSGGIQEETTYLNKRCLTLRDDTERPITVDLGTNTLVGSNSETIISEINSHLEGNIIKSQIIEKWDGKTSERIVEVLFDR